MLVLFPAGTDRPREARAVRRGHRPTGPRGSARGSGRTLPQPLPPLPARQPLPVQVPLQLASTLGPRRTLNVTNGLQRTGIYALIVNRAATYSHLINFMTSFAEYGPLLIYATNCAINDRVMAYLYHSGSKRFYFKISL